MKMNAHCVLLDIHLMLNILSMLHTGTVKACHRNTAGLAKMFMGQNVLCATNSLVRHVLKVITRILLVAVGKDIADPASFYS